VSSKALEDFIAWQRNKNVVYRKSFPRQRHFSLTLWDKPLLQKTFFIYQHVFQRYSSFKQKEEKKIKLILYKQKKSNILASPAKKVLNNRHSSVFFRGLFLGRGRIESPTTECKVTLP
jgi:hypothetical protein